MLEVSNNNNNNTINIDNNKNKGLPIQYKKEELDKITLDFVTQINKYIDRVNDRISRLLKRYRRRK